MSRNPVTRLQLLCDNVKIVSCVNFIDKKRKKEDEQILEELINYLFWKVSLYKGVQDCNRTIFAVQSVE